MNKGLELIEAHWLFGIAYDQISIVVHPESIIHSLVEFIDGSQVAQLGLPDMRLPIQYALCYPERSATTYRKLSLTEIGALHFSEPDTVRFPALRLAREAGMAGQTFPTVLSAADEVAVDAFCQGNIGFTEIALTVEGTLAAHDPQPVTGLAVIEDADAWARRTARQIVAAKSV
jgi:1-deoxy-D-xylulose-5-phosphate reductoisomerase